MVEYIKNNFFVRQREFDSFEHMKQLALKWLEEEADGRVHGTVKEVVRERFERKAPYLGPLPLSRYDTSYMKWRHVHWDGYIDVRGNRYNVPGDLCRARVMVRISINGKVSIYYYGCKVAEHRLRPRRKGWVTTVPDHHRSL